jgi:hypothetical protein
MLTDHLSRIKLALTLHTNAAQRFTIDFWKYVTRLSNKIFWAVSPCVDMQDTNLVLLIMWIEAGLLKLQGVQRSILLASHYQLDSPEEYLQLVFCSFWNMHDVYNSIFPCVLLVNRVREILSATWACLPLAGGFAMVRQLGGKLTNTKPTHRVKHTQQAKNLFLAPSNYNPRVISYCWKM